MKILVDELSDTPRSYCFEADSNWWRAHGGAVGSPAWQMLEPFRVDLSATLGLGEELLLEGRLTGLIGAECSRCLARYRPPVAEAFRLALSPAGGRVPADPEGAQALGRDGMCLGEEFEAGWYQGSSLSLAAFVSELIALALPMQLLCREDCEGLCPDCGSDLNRSVCQCAEARTNSPFAVLEALRGGRNEGDS